MHIISMAILVLFSSVISLFAKEIPKDNIKEVEIIIEAGDYEKAEEILRKLVASEPKNAKAHKLLGDAFRKSGKLEEALKEYEDAKSLGGENPELLKSIGTTYKWMKRYSEAKRYYQRAIALNPKDEEAKDDMENLKNGRGLKLNAWTGGWEPDYTKESYEGSLWYGGFDQIDLNVGYSYADQVYYTRHKVYGSGYYFYNPDSYMKLYLALKDYNYPTQKANPDSSAYDKVPVIEIEDSYWFNKILRGTLTYEYFRPSFFYDKDAHANNHKVSAELYYITPLKYLRLKLIYAMLRDPDPDATEIKGRNNSKTSLGTAGDTDVKYRTTSLLGGGMEIAQDKWSGELKYLPNRDLDNSYDYSILAGVGYGFTDKLSVRLDYVYDSYSSDSNFSGKEANVYLVSSFYKLSPEVNLGIGYKYLDLPTGNENTGFISIAYKTGLGF